MQYTSLFVKNEMIEIGFFLHFLLDKFYYSNFSTEFFQQLHFYLTPNRNYVMPQCI